MRTYSLFACAAVVASFLMGCQWQETKDTPSEKGTMVMPPPDNRARMTPMNDTYSELTPVSFSDAGMDFDPFVSGDGKTVLFATTKMSPKSDIVLKAVSSRVIEQVTHTPNANEKQPQLSPDGKSILYASDKEGRFNIYEVSSTVRGAREMEVVRNERVNEQPCYSPDGSRIAYVTWMPRKGDWWIAVMDRSTQQEKLYGPGVFPRFSPDGKKLVFQKARVRMPQWFSIWVLDLDRETVSEIISSDKWAAITPNWSPDGKRIIFAAVNKSLSMKGMGTYMADDIYTVWADGSHLIRLTDGDAPDWSPFWASNGRVFFISTRNGHQNVWSIMPRDMDPFHPDTMESSASMGHLDTL